jgi:hypothetical protein
MGLSGLFNFAIVTLIIAPTSAVNNTTSSEDSLTSGTIGWFDVKYRSTTTILYGCLSTIVACTYTSLHLNVPSPRDSMWRRLRRKAKWMFLTILFPEFTFAKAVCELQMAAEDWCKLRTESASGTFNWSFEHNRVVEALNSFFNFFIGLQIWASPGKLRRLRRSSQQETSGRQQPVQELDVAVQTRQCSDLSATASLRGHVLESQRWTLTHSYFANMGGFVLLMDIYRNRSPQAEIGLEYITAQGLLKCCLPQGVNPLRTVRLSQMEISDKAKADAFVKIIAIAQSSWLVVSISTRVGRRLPVSQLEVCTVAFAVISFATYIVNWSKPKDIDVPVFIRRDDENEERSANRGHFDHHGTNVTHRASKPLSVTYDMRWPRVANDELRPQEPDGQFFVLNGALSTSTVVFGAIHCVAWLTEFPTRTERIIWEVASAISTVNPVFAIFVMTLTRLAVSSKVRTYEKLLLAQVRSSKPLSADWTRVPIDDSMMLVARPDRNAALGNFWSSEHVDIPFYIKKFSAALWLVHDRGEVDEGLLRQWNTLQKKYDRLQENGLYLEYSSDGLGDSVPRSNGGEYSTSGDRKSYIGLVIQALNDPDRSIMESIEKLQDIQRTSRRLSAVFTLTSWSLYAVARLMILGLAFAGLRSQNERLYIATWTRYLPNIS